MKTDTKSYKSILLIVLFIFSTMAIIPVHASTGHPTLGTTDVLTDSAVYTQAEHSVEVRAGSTAVYSQDLVTPPTDPAYLAIEFGGVDFSGSQFALYLSTDGLSIISAGDIAYTQGAWFLVSNLTQLGPLSQQTFTGAVWQNGKSPTFYYGNNGAQKLVIGPVPFHILGGTYWIKVFDGSTGAVAVSAQQVTILPNINVSPSTAVPAGYPISVEGTAWAVISKVNITVWSPNNSTIRTSHLLNVNANGTFLWTFPMPDEGKFALDTSASALYTDYVEVFNTTTGKLPASDPSLDLFAPINYIGRAFYNIWSFDNSGGLVDSSQPDPSDIGSGSGAVGLYANVLGSFIVNGTSFYSSGTVTAFADYGTANQVSLPLTFIYAVDDMGYFNASFTVPNLSMGEHLISFVDNTWNWNFSIFVLTTLIVSPSSGTCSNPTTTVTVSGYGFDASSPVTVYWLGIVNTFRFEPYTPLEDYILENPAMNTTATGYFNYSFTIPDTFGGWHYIYANSTSTNGLVGFWVNDSYTISVTSAAVGTVVTIHGEGLGTGHIWENNYGDIFNWFGPEQPSMIFGTYWATPALAYDNIPMLQGAYALFSENDFDGYDDANATGEYFTTFYAAGVPMTHIVQVFDVNTDNWQYGIGYDTNPAALKATFMLSVTGSTLEGAKILSQLSGISGNLTSLQSSMTSLSSSVSSLTTLVNGIQSSLTSLASSQASSFSSLNTAVSGVSSAVSALSSSMSSQFTSLNSAVSSLASSDSAGFSGLNTAVSGVTSTLGGKIDGVNTAVSGIASSVSTLSGNVNTLGGKVDTLTSTTSTINNATATLSTISTILYIAVILAAIAVVLEIVILIRKK